MTDEAEYYSPNQKVIAIAPKFTSLASVLGSGFIIFEIFRDKKKLRTTFHRILLGMCLTDFLSSSWFFLGTWPIPRGTPGVFGARGNMGSCVAQGFFSQLSITTAYYNASLSAFYLLQIRAGWRSEQIRRRAEPILHAVPLTVGLSTSLAGVALESYNNDYWECWIAPLPTDCRETWRYGSEGNCVRGDNASLYRWIFYYMFLWIAIVAVFVCMILVYRSVLAKEEAVDRHAGTLPAWATHQHKFSKKVAVQGYWYCGAFFTTWFWPTATRLVQVIIGDRTPFWLICLTAMFVPIQGSLNFVVYVRPRYKKYKWSRSLAKWCKKRRRKCRGCRCMRRSKGSEEQGEEYDDTSHYSGFSTHFFTRHDRKFSSSSEAGGRLSSIGHSRVGSECLEKVPEEGEEIDEDDDRDDGRKEKTEVRQQSEWNV